MCWILIIDIFMGYPIAIIQSALVELISIGHHIFLMTEQ